METMLRNNVDFFQKNVIYLLFYQTYQTTLVYTNGALESLFSNLFSRAIDWILARISVPLKVISFRVDQPWTLKYYLTLA